MAAAYGADLRTAALQFSAAPDVAAAMIVGARSEEQALANVTSMQARVPPELWVELKRQRLIEQNAPTPGSNLLRPLRVAPRFTLVADVLAESAAKSFCPRTESCRRSRVGLALGEK